MNAFSQEDNEIKTVEMIERKQISPRSKKNYKHLY